MKYTKYQKQILQKLLTKYESSKTYSGQNEITQSFSILPEVIFPDYNNDYANVDLIIDFEKDVFQLEKENLISTIKKYERITKLIAVHCEDNWNRIRQILDVKEKKEQLKIEIDFYSQYKNVNSVIALYSQNQIEKLLNGKKAQHELEDATKIINLLDFILNNKQEILERELSIAVLHDSKLWEKKYKTKVCNILKEFGNYSNTIQDLTEKESIKAILEEHSIFDNPTYIYFKGSGVIHFIDGNAITLHNDTPLAISSVSLNNVKSIDITDLKVMTVENLTSFNRMETNNTFYIYLSGYHNSSKQNFLRKIYNSNSQKEYFHFGDIDPDGFLIYENLKQKTEIPFALYKMTEDELIKFSEYCKPLDPNDTTKAKGLIARNCHTEIMNYMLKNNCKLEQEIISWMKINTL